MNRRFRFASCYAYVSIRGRNLRAVPMEGDLPAMGSRVQDPVNASRT
ncbi:MAG: hypothetical protein NTZ78_03795 [Candidatus Aureabacteria bacterium]|nr:hypothetical protein [Candidatus Auribacterota bacterium]